MTSILDVIDNFFYRDESESDDVDIRRIPGRRLFEFGEEVRRFADAHDQLDESQAERPVYLGGWPSANYWAVHGDLLLSSLLYTGRVLVKDPLADWFSDEQYQVNPRHLSRRSGYLRADGSPATAETRWFLTHVISTLRTLRPLIEAGLLVLVPSEKYISRNPASILDLEQRLSGELLADVPAYARRFGPEEIAVEDNQRGMFVFAGGDQEQQVRDALNAGIRYFAREYSFARAHGSTYVAPFRHELHLCTEGLDKSLSPGSRVVQAVLRSNMPVFSQPTPELIARLHGDDNFAEFRQQLHSVYSATPVERSDEEVEEYLADQEQALLLPSIQKAQTSVDRGFLGRIGAVLSGAGFGLAAGIASDLLTGSGGWVAGMNATASLADSMRQHLRPSGAQAVWMALVRHNRTATTEIRPVIPQAGQGVVTNAWDHWGIRPQPSMTLTISRGALLADHIPWRGERLTDDTSGSPSRPNAPCSCGSGIKYKHCCRRVSIPQRDA